MSAAVISSVAGRRCKAARRRTTTPHSAYGRKVRGSPDSVSRAARHRQAFRTPRAWGQGHARNSERTCAGAGRTGSRVAPVPKFGCGHRGLPAATTRSGNCTAHVGSRQRGSPPGNTSVQKGSGEPGDVLGKTPPYQQTRATGEPIVKPAALAKPLHSLSVLRQGFDHRRPDRLVTRSWYSCVDPPYGFE
jgi:hypothetical protein